MREPIHPGETLREDLDALGMSASELARRIEVPANRITGILNGQRAVTGDTALRLGRFFGTSGEFWLNLQKLYELRCAERESDAGDRFATDTSHRFQGNGRNDGETGEVGAGQSLTYYPDMESLLRELSAIPPIPDEAIFEFVYEASRETICGDKLRGGDEDGKADGVCRCCRHVCDNPRTSA